MRSRSDSTTSRPFTTPAWRRRRIRPRDLRELSNLDLSRLPLRRPEGGPGEGRPTGPGGRPSLARQGPTGHRGRPLGRGRSSGSGAAARPAPIAPLWRAWLEWARGSGQPAEALEAARQLGPGQLEPGERLELRAWLEQQRGETGAESTALERWLQIEPTATRALERLAELAHRAGRHDRVAEFRRRKAEVERAMEAYRDRLWSDEPLRTAADRAELGRMAEAAGRPREARALYRLGAQGRPRRTLRPGRPGPARPGRRHAEKTLSPRRPIRGPIWRRRPYPGTRSRVPGPAASSPSPTMPRPSACGSSTTMPRPPSANCPSPSAAGSPSWTTTATAGSTSTASRAAPSPPSPTPDRHLAAAGIACFTTEETAPSRTSPTARGSAGSPAGMATASPSATSTATATPTSS